MTGLIVCLISALLIYVRITEWKRYKNDYFDDKIKNPEYLNFNKQMHNHQTKLIIYAIAFVIGIIIIFI